MSDVPSSAVTFFTKSGSSPPTESISEIVRRSGGIYVGIEDLLPGQREPLVLFTSPQTYSTLALPLSQVTLENVAAKIEASNRVFGVLR